MGNSPLAEVIQLSPNRTHPRRHAIDTVTIHCIVGQWTAGQGCRYFADPTVRASANYIVGCDGSIGLCVDEGDRAWTTGGTHTVNGITGSQNDHRAITIEVASGTKHPYAVTDQAMEALLTLLADICKRNPGIGQLRWRGDKSLVGKTAQQNMTVHRWFADKACPGDYLYARHGEIAREVNRRLDKEEEALDKETFDRFMDGYQAAHARPVPDSTPADWEQDAVEWAVKSGLMAGDGSGNLMLHSPITRAQFCVLLKRYHDKQGI